MKIFFLFLSFSIILLSTAQNQIKVNLDKRHIQQVVSMNGQNPVMMEKYFLKKDNYIPEKQNLGFRWSVRDLYFSGGYISFDAKFYYLGDSLQSYKLICGLPENKKLMPKYLEWYGAKSSFRVNDKIEIFHHIEKIRNVVPNCPNPFIVESLPAEARLFMSPESGELTYPYNRIPKIYNIGLLEKIFPTLTEKQSEILLYSINPFSRLLAIGALLATNKTHLLHKNEEWIKQVFAEIPECKLQFGCMVDSWPSSNVPGYLAGMLFSDTTGTR